MCKEAPLSTVYILSFGFTIAWGLDVIAGDWRVSPENSFLCTYAQSPFLSYRTLCGIVPDTLGTLSQRLNPSSPESLDVVPCSFLHDVSTGIRLLEVSDRHVSSWVLLQCGAQGVAQHGCSPFRDHVRILSVWICLRCGARGLAIFASVDSWPDLHGFFFSKKTQKRMPEDCLLDSYLSGN